MAILRVKDAEGNIAEFPYLRGEKGEQGYTPQKGVDYDDGYTPVKGVDYWTASDKSQMVSDVLAALPTWNGGSY